MLRTFVSRAMAAEGAEEVVSLQDVLEEDRQLEQTANAVLGDSDDSHCTYPKVHYHSLLCINKSNKLLYRARIPYTSVLPM